ncbi:hypothetical protein IW252_000888 [Zhihengliuella flava]|uniref:Uncharacterized protein n=1 Tax=Zhihengliuella flava TaxID=1285193 RepID=A0A931DAT6_9MICC|nr:hypothetical protein [Zhihengliuella flava]
MTQLNSRRPSALERKIRDGRADPITPREREIAAGIRARYEAKYGPLTGVSDRESEPKRGWFGRRT